MADDMGGFEKIGPVKINAPPEKNSSTDMGGFERVTPPSFGEGVGTGLMDKVYGAAQLGARGVIDPPPIAYSDAQAAAVAPERRQEQIAAVDQTVQKREKTLEAEGYNKGWGRTVGNILGDVAVTAPLAIVPGGAGATALSRMGMGALGGAAGGAITGAIEPVADGNYATGKAKQIGVSTALGGAGGAVAGTLAGAIAKDSPAEIDAFIRNNYRRSVKPTVAGKATASEAAKYDQQMASAIDSIVGNKANLTFADEAGAAIKGQLPKTLEQFSQAIEQTRRGIFQQYDALAQQAGAAGAKVDVAPIIAELNAVRYSPHVQDFSPEVGTYIDGLIGRIGNRGSLSATEAQDAIQHLNEMLSAFYRNPNMEMASKASVNRLIANKLRVGLDAAIEDAVEPGYQALKNQYGALKSIEKDVVKRAIVTSREPQGGGIIDRMANIGSAAEVVHALVNPKALLTAAAIKGAQMTTRYLKSPNRAVTRLFEAAERKPQAPTSQLPMGQYLAPVIGGITGDAASEAMGLR